MKRSDIRLLGITFQCKLVKPAWNRLLTHASTSDRMISCFSASNENGAIVTPVLCSDGKQFPRAQHRTVSLLIYISRNSMEK